MAAVPPARQRKDHMSIRNQFACAALAATFAVSTTAWAASPLALDHTIQLAGVHGKFDHFAIDASGNRLFVAATAAHEVLAIDLNSGKIAQTLTGFGKPHGIVWDAEDGRLFVTDGVKGELDVFSGAPLASRVTIKLAEDADDMAYDSAQHLLYIGNGGTNAANPPSVAIIDTKTLKLVKKLPAASHPEGLDIDTAHGRIFANIADSAEVLAIGSRLREITQTWRLTGARDNTPIAYDAADNLVLVGCRKPAQILVLDAQTGKQLASAPADAGVDDLFFDPAEHRAYFIAGAGKVDVYAVTRDGTLDALPATETAAGAKTGLFVASQSMLYVGIPGGANDASIRVYKTSGE